ncbi:glycosyltransferase [Psychroserpens sp. BH13MA-6]
MTIIHITSTLGGGGAEQMVFQLAKQSMTTHKTIVVSLSSTLVTLENRFKQQGIEYHLLGVTSFKNTSLVTALKNFKAIVNQYEDVVIHCHLYHAALFGSLYKLSSRKTPLIFTLHSNEVEGQGKKLMLFLTKPFRNVDIIFSKKGKKWYNKSKSVSIPNGVNFKDFDFHKNEAITTNGVFQFLFLGRLSQEKSPLRMVEAAQQLLQRQMDHFMIHVVGDGPLKNELETQIKIHKLEAYFELHGFQNDVKPFLAKADCLVLPSLWEGLPVVIIEAAAAKTPIIATPVGSIPDYLNDSNAYLSELESFDEAMAEVIKHQDMALEKSEKLYEDIASIFDIEHVFQEHLKIYHSCLNQSKSNV